jgi:FtsH-binding integral membrane protein
MSDLDRNVATAPFGRTIDRVSPVAIDEGLRAYMLRIYNYMVLGLAITGFAALGVYLLSVTGDTASAARVVRNGVEGYARISGGAYLTPIGHLLFVSPFKWVVILAPLAMVFLLSFGIARVRPLAGHVLFWVFAALIGLSLASVFLVFTHTSIVRVFFITAAAFGALSLWGYTTQRDLTGLGSFLFMGLFGVILGALVNLFLQAPVLQWVVSVVGVLVFTGLTAYETQRLKNEYIYAAMDGETTERSAILGALSLYLNFINLFTLLLQLLGQRDE